MGLAKDFACIKSVEQKTTAKEVAYLDLVLTDAQGEVPAKLWDYTPERHGRYEAGMIIKVRGSVDVWNNAPQLRIERIRHADEKDGVDMAGLRASARCTHPSGCMPSCSPGWSNVPIKTLPRSLKRCWKRIRIAS